jgi:hypothetical protein
MGSAIGDLLASLRDAFEHLGVGWYLFGAQAALVHGTARLTADVDVTVDLGKFAPDTLMEILETAGFRALRDDPEFVARTRVLPVRHTATGMPVDIVIAGPGIEELFLQRAQVHDLGGVKVPVACAEDVIVMKILGGRPKDLDDVLAILAAKRHDLDLELVKDTLRLIEHALDRSDLVSELERIAAQPLG